MQLFKTQSKDVHKRSLWVKFCNTNTCSSYCAVSSESTIWSEKKWFNPLHPNPSMNTFHIVLYTFPQVLTRRFCSTIFSW